MESNLAPLWGNQSITRSPCVTYSSVLLKASRVGYGFALLPAVVMIVMPMTALCSNGAEIWIEYTSWWYAGGDVCPWDVSNDNLLAKAHTIRC